MSKVIVEMERACLQECDELRTEIAEAAAEITALRAALEQEREKVERLRDFANIVAKISVEMEDDDDFGLSRELERAGLLDEELNPTALLSGRES